MGSYYIPNNSIKGEGRILYIFTPKSLIYTAIGAFIGLIFYFIFGVLLGLKPVGYIAMGVLALIGYGVATIKMPTAGNSKLAKNVGGDSIDDIVMRYIAFRKGRKIYSYSVERKEPDYLSLTDKLSINNMVGKVTNMNMSSAKTKEDK